MNLLLRELIFLTALILLQAVVWRIALPRRQTIAIILLHSILTVIFSSAFFFYEFSITIPETIVFIMLHYAALMSYLITFSAVAADSPSLVILYMLHKNKNGISLIELSDCLDNSVLLLPRINDLVNDKMLIINEDVLSLTRKGARMARLFCVYRNIMHIHNDAG